MPRFIELVKVVGITLVANIWFIVPFLDFFAKDKFFVNDGSRIGSRIQSNGIRPDRLISPLYFGECGEVAAAVDLAMTFILFGSIIYLICYKSKRRKEIGIALLFVALALYMCTDVFPFDFLKRFPVVNDLVISMQFPWRFMVVAILGITFILGSMIADIEENNLLAEKGISYLCLGLFVTSIACGIYYQQRADLDTFIEKSVYDVAGLNDFGQGGGEYIPTGTDPSYLNRVYVYNLDGNVWVKDYDISSAAVSFDCENSSGAEGIVTVPRLFYRGYVAKDIATGRTFELTKDDNNSLSVVIPTDYQGTVKVFFREPWYWRLTELISLAAICLGIVFRKKLFDFER